MGVDAHTKDLINWPTIFSISAREDEEDINKEVGQGNEDGNDDCEDSDEEEESDDDDGQVIHTYSLQSNRQLYKIYEDRLRMHNGIQGYNNERLSKKDILDGIK